MIFHSDHREGERKRGKVLLLFNESEVQQTVRYSALELASSEVGSTSYGRRKGKRKHQHTHWRAFCMRQSAHMGREEKKPHRIASKRDKIRISERSKCSIRKARAREKKERVRIRKA